MPRLITAPCLITAPMMTLKRLRDKKKTTEKISKNKIFSAKTEYLNLKAHSNKVKMQSDTLATQIYFLLTIQLTESFPHETMLQVNKENDQ